MCLIAMEWGGTTYAWSSPTILGLLCGSLVAFAIFLVIQYHKGNSAMVPLEILSQRVIYCGVLTVVFQLGGLYVLSYYTPVWFQVVKGATPLLSGLFILPTVISQIFGATVSGMLGI
jgi:formate/nitrite transporter FocA (FNT family)